MYAWVNIYANWDPYGNTGGVKIAVVSNDQDYVSTEDGVVHNVGNDVIKSLKATTSIGWQFMFIISFYLVRIEYSDYQLQGRINKATDREGEEATSLVLESIESNRNAMHDLLMREESHLPFRFGFEAKTAGDESEYHEDVLPLYTDNADIEAFGDEDALGHDDEEYDYAPVSGLSEDEDFLPGADSYTMEDFDAEFGVSTPAKDETPIAVLDDGVDGIDTLA